MEYSSDLFSLTLEYYDELNNKYIDDMTLYDYLSNNDIIDDFYFILHDKDTKAGEQVRKHYHIIIHLKKCKSKTNIINMFASEMFINKNIVQCRYVENFIKCLRYLTHMDDKDKYQYSVDEVWSFKFGIYESTINNLYNPYSLDYNDLMDIIKKSNTITEVYASIGLKYSKLYRNVIVDLWKDKNRYD